jgi:hydroxymethylglutaryl-CoA reductase
MMCDPSAKELSEVMVSVGLARNFAALRALVSERIQKGYMRLHSGVGVLGRPVQKL